MVPAPALGAQQRSWLGYRSLGHPCRGEPAAFALEQLRERPPEQGCAGVTSGGSSARGWGGIAFPCDRGWKDLAVFSLRFGDMVPYV